MKGAVTRDSPLFKCFPIPIRYVIIRRLIKTKEVKP